MNTDLARKVAFVTGQFRPHIVLGHAGSSEEVAAAVVFLASNAASFVTGTNFRVDGGSVATV